MRLCIPKSTKIFCEFKNILLPKCDETSYINYMKNKPVLIVDSGIGGLSILYLMQKNIKNCDYIYFADSKNAPFGNKSISDLRKECIDNLKFLIKKYTPQTIIFACNTLTATTIYQARKVFDIPIIGTEPAIKIALQKNKKKILLLATQNTIKHNRNLQNYLDSENVITKTCTNLATMIEQNINNLDKLQLYIKKELNPFLSKIDAIVLGCTHYIFLRPLLKRICPTSIEIIDGNLGVVRQAQKLILCNKPGKISIYTNTPNERKILTSAWEILQTQGGKICVES